MDPTQLESQQSMSGLEIYEENVRDFSHSHEADYFQN